MDNGKQYEGVRNRENKVLKRVRRKKMIEKFQLKGGICELNFGYNAKMEVYTNSSSDITKLYAIRP